MKTLDFSYYGGEWPIYNCFDFLWIHFDAFRRYDESQEYNWTTHEGTVLEIDVEAFSTKEMANSVEMSEMLLPGFAVNKDVVEINDDEFPDIRLQQVSHNPHEGTESIC